MLVDSHAHLDFPTSPRSAGLRGTSVDDLESALVRAKQAGVGKIITVGTTINESKKAIEIAENSLDKNLQIYASVGIHPKDGKEDIENLGIDDAIDRLRAVVKSSGKIVAIGECGLDYYDEQETRNNRPETTDKEKEFQRDLFEAQIRLACDLDLPLIIHCRNGWDEIFDLISNFQFQISNFKLRGVFHSWTGDWNAAKRAFGLDFYISFSGIVTFKNAPDIQEVAKKTPLERILIETDSPYLAPEPFRGKTNEPKNVRITAQFLAKIRGLPFAKIAKATTVNAERLFGI